MNDEKLKLTILQGDIFERIAQIPSDSIDLCITSPPYWGLRAYGAGEKELGAEPTMEAYLDNTIRWVKEVHRVLKPTGSFVLNIGDCFFTKRNQQATEQVSNSLGYVQRRMGFDHEYGIYKTKQLLSVSSFAYCRIVSETDFVCRGEHIWAKPNVPSPIRSRLKHSHEKLFWFVKDADNYYFDAKAWMKNHATEDKRTCAGNFGEAFAKNKGSRALADCGTMKTEQTIEHSWRIVPVGAKQSGFELNGKMASEHIAPFPENLIEPYIKSLCPYDGVVLDPFLGSGTTMRVAMENQRNCIGIELNEKSIAYAKKRLNWGQGLGTEYKED